MLAEYTRNPVRKEGIDMVNRPRVNMSEEIFVEILERLANGETLRAICKSDVTRFPRDSTVRIAVMKNDEMFKRYTHARDVGLDAVAEELFEIADDTSGDTITDADGNEYERKEWVSRTRIRVDVRKWYLCKIAPKRYGEQLTLKGDKEAPLTVQIIDDV